MALSRIWAAFILISIVVAGARYAFVPADKEILSSMVTGKAGDTLYVAKPVLPGVSGATAAAPGSAVKGQRAAGVFSTCKKAGHPGPGLFAVTSLPFRPSCISQQTRGGRVLAPG